MLSDPREIQGPILITGAGGFVGANLLRQLLHVRSDVIGIARSGAWRLADIDSQYVRQINLENNAHLISLLDEFLPRTVFNLAAYGAYPTQQDSDRIFGVTLDVARILASWCVEHHATFVQAGTSSEYGTNCKAPLEDSAVQPNSTYAVAKVAATLWASHLAHSKGLLGGVARLYSVYGPYEEPSRLVPTLIRAAQRGELPPFSPRNVSRDFVYVEDACRALVSIANFSVIEKRFEVFNIGTGEPVKMEDVARIAIDAGNLSAIPSFGDPLRDWDLIDWYANPQKANNLLSWYPQFSFKEGFSKTKLWYTKASNAHLLDLRSQHQRRASKVTAVVACYKDAKAIPIMYERLIKTFEQIGSTYEIIFVNDGSPDDTREVIESISSKDPSVVGISHSRNFGSQAAFLSGMRLATGDSCVLLDGDLQDPPELIQDFVKRYEEGFDVVYGRRVNREASRLMNLSYRTFYRVMARLSQFHVPRDAGDFSLMSKRVVDHLLAMPERELFLRATRAFVGFRQSGVDYVRPERMFGKSTNNLMKNFGWATRGILTVSRAPLAALSIVGVSLFSVSVVALLVQLIVRIVRPDLSPPGVVSVLLVSVFFGSINLLAVSVVGAYVGRILEESKNRPRFVVEFVTRNGISQECNVADVN